MSLDVDIRHRVGALDLRVRFAAPGGVTALFGRSGAGKSTVIRAVAGLTAPDQGRIVAAGRVLFDRTAGVDVAAHRRRVGVVFQDARLFPHLTVAGNLAFPGWVRTKATEGTRARVVALLGLEPLLGRRPAALSGGERQRVAIGRTLLSNPDLLLLDEPLAALDEPRKGEIMPYLERLRDEAGVPILYVSHSVSEVARLADRVVVLRDGRSVAVGPASDVFAERGALDARSTGTVLEGIIQAHDRADGLTALRLAGGASLTLPAIDAPVGAGVRVRLRATDVMVAREEPVGLSTQNTLAATIVEIVVGDGPGALVSLSLKGGGARVVARLTRRAVRELGLEVGLDCFAVLKAFAVPADDVAIVRSSFPDAQIARIGDASQ